MYIRPKLQEDFSDFCHFPNSGGARTWSAVQIWTNCSDVAVNKDSGSVLSVDVVALTQYQEIDQELYLSTLPSKHPLYTHSRHTTPTFHLSLSHT